MYTVSTTRTTPTTRSGSQSHPKLTWLGSSLLLGTCLLLGSRAGAVAPTEDLAAFERALPTPALTKLAPGATQAPSATAAASWSAFEAVTGQGWLVQWNLATGLPNRALPSSYDAALLAQLVPEGLTGTARAALLDAEGIDRASRDLYETLAIAFPSLPVSTDLEIFAIEERGGVWWVIYRQVIDGIPVEEARADFRYSADGHLLSLGLSLIPNTAPAGAALLDENAAAQEAIASLRRDGLSQATLAASSLSGNLAEGRVSRTAIVSAGPNLSPHAVYRPVYAEDGLSVSLHLAQVVRTEVTDPPARFVSEIDAVTGDLIRRENEYHYLDIGGHFDSSVHPSSPFDVPVVVDEQDLRVTVLGVGEVFTDADGNFAVPSPDGFPRTVRSNLNGRWAKIDDRQGADPVLQTLATPGLPVDLHWTSANSDASERDAFHHSNVIHTWQKQVDPAFTGVDYEMLVSVNLAGSCNAFWDGSGINFYRAAGGCVNIGEIADVVYHEYGHGTNQFAFAPGGPSGAEHEGMADYQAATITDQPLIGIGFFGEGSFLRTCDNERQWPAPECGEEPHCVGEVIAGALWHMRENLVDHLGQAEGVELANHLFHHARFGRDRTFDGYYLDLLAIDDDNGTLVDGTPHDTQIVAAFDRHNIGSGWALDILHAALPNTDNDATPYDIVAVFSCPAELIESSLDLHYRTLPSGPFTTVDMSPTGGAREYQASIPAQPLGTQVQYYLSGAADTLGVTAVLPPGAPANTFSFLVEVDTQAPTILHEVLADKSYAIWPAVVRAQVGDNHGVGSVLVEWEKNGSAQAPFALNPIEESYDGTFNVGVGEGDQVAYRVKASDISGTPNVAYDPPVGLHEFDVVHDFADEMENGTQDFTHAVVTPGFVDQWHRSTERNFTSGGTTSWKFGSTGNGQYADGADGALFTPPISLGVGASLKFQHWIDAEQGSSTTAWDGAVVELSNDGGASWQLITPIGGYTHTIIDNPASPFVPGYPCWSGTFNWRLAEFDLSAFQGETVRLRFRFGTDGAATQEGWHIDSLVLDPNDSSVDAPENDALPVEASIRSLGPNPFRATDGGLTIRFAVPASSSPDASAGKDLRIDIIDVAGRRVRTLVDGALPAGYQSVTWNGRTDRGDRANSGVYFVRYQTGADDLTAKVLVVK